MEFVLTLEMVQPATPWRLQVLDSPAIIGQQLAKLVEPIQADVMVLKTSPPRLPVATAVALNLANDRKNTYSPKQPLTPNTPSTYGTARSTSVAIRQEAAPSNVKVAIVVRASRPHTPL